MAIKNFGGKDFYENTRLILPTTDYFPSKIEGVEEIAISTFDAVKKYAGMEEWPCRLEKQDEDLNTQVAPTLAVQNAPKTPLGTFEAKENNEIVITYNPELVNNPMQLVATYAHELSHYLTGSGQEEPPGGWENWEFATDIAATFLGFGIFMANSAFNFNQFTEVDSQGWQYSRNGYLSEEEHIYALAIFLGLQGISDGAALSHLKPNLKALLKKALAEISRSELISELKAVEYVSPDN